MSTTQALLNPTLHSPEVRDFEAALRQRVVGQDRAVHSLARAYQVYLAGLSAPGRPLVNLLFLGPTGSGKTRLVEAAGEALLGDIHAVIKLDCAEFQHSHEIAKLIGSPPGYLGHRETQPLLTQEVLESHYTEKEKIALVLFDEIEKASDALWQLLLGILDKATLTLGDNRRVDFSRTMIFLTSNLGTGEVNKLMSGGIGFANSAEQEQEDLDQKIYHAASEAARRKFSPEFMNRIDRVIVFRALQRPQLEKILDIELTGVQERIIAATGSQFVFQCRPAARNYLLAEGTDPQCGARHLKRAVERHLVFPLSNLLATHQIELGDLITVDYDPAESQLMFYKESQGALVGAKAEPCEEAVAVPPATSTRTGAARAAARRATRDAA